MTWKMAFGEMGTTTIILELSAASKTEKPVIPTLGIIYTCSQQRKDSKTKSEEGVVWMSGWLGEGFQLFILWILGAKSVAAKLAVRVKKCHL